MCRLLWDITICILGTSSKAAQALPEDQHPGTKDTEQPRAEAKPKSVQGSRTAVIWRLQTAQAEKCRAWDPVSLVPQLTLPPPLHLGWLGRVPLLLSCLSPRAASSLPPSSHSDLFLHCAGQISVEMEGARQIFIFTSWALLQSLLPGYHLAHLLSASQIN